MIRIANLEDLTAIDSIGTLIKDNFSKQNHTRERINLDYVKIFVYENQSIIKGFIEIECHYETTDLINIAVLKEYQNQGIASSLLNYVIENINQQNIILEVNENNIKAIKFYQRNNFKEINRRNKYYDNLYDAIIMERKTI
ncbi:MAG: GNAT family N-acetyltransferase [Bacilli bacterium]|nr:GNAT family N-acetyltransferase [Bacilli bacterium]